MIDELSHQRLKDVLKYDRETGVFLWLDRGGKQKKSLRNRPAGRTNANGYIYIGIDGKLYLAHRLAWFYSFGEWPIADLDHKDGNPSHNCLDNLRLASKSQNIANSRRRIDNTSGHKGVTFDKDRGTWNAQITVIGRHINIGRFITRDEAHSAYCAAAKTGFGEFARTGE